MTKMHRGKKAAASLMAGILLCQMFVFGVSKTSADAREVAKKMSFEVVGEGIVTVTDTAERTQEITSGSVIEVPKGMCVRVQAESPKETDIAVHVLDKDGNYELEDVSEVQGKCFWRDVTAMELEKKVVVTFGKEDKKIRAVRTGQTRGNYNKPEAGDVFTGNCVITAVDGGNGHTVHSVTIGGFTGILAGVTATGGCADHTAAAPYVGQEYTYRYTVTGVNKVTGEVMGNLYCTSVTGSTDGVTKDSGGRLIGYQRISGSALIYRNYSGYAKLKKGKTQTMLTNGNPQYSLEDACYGIYKDRSATNEAATFTTDKEGNSKEKNKKYFLLYTENRGRKDATHIKSNRIEMHLNCILADDISELKDIVKPEVYNQTEEPKTSDEKLSIHKRYEYLRLGQEIRWVSINTGKENICPVHNLKMDPVYIHFDKVPDIVSYCKRCGRVYVTQEHLKSIEKMIKNRRYQIEVDDL